MGSQGSDGDTAGQDGTGEVWGAPAARDHHGAVRSPRGVRGHGGRWQGSHSGVAELGSAHGDGERRGHRVRAAGRDRVWGHPTARGHLALPSTAWESGTEGAGEGLQGFIHHTTSRHGTGGGWAPSSGQVLPFMRPWGGHGDRGEDKGRGCRG